MRGNDRAGTDRGISAPATITSKLPQLERGSFLTMLTTWFANAVIDRVNWSLGMRQGRGINIVSGDSGPVIEIKQDTWDKIQEGGEGGTGTLNWMGEWNDTTDFAVGDITIRSTLADMVAGKSGTFVSLKAGANHEPPSGETMANEYWATLARGHWRKLVMTNGATSMTIDGGKVVIVLDGSGTQIVIDPAAIPAGMVGKTMTFQPIKACCSDGVIREIYVLGTEAT